MNAAQVSAADPGERHPCPPRPRSPPTTSKLRYQDALAQLLTDTVKAYQRTLDITTNQYNAGTANSADKAAAQTQLDTAKASLINAGVLRAQYEHAVAVLTGVAPAELAIATTKLASDVPVAPGVIPSVLLQRRPDVAAAERTMAQQNALIGVQVAAFYPGISLSALYGYSGNPLGSLIQAANRGLVARCHRRPKRCSRVACATPKSPPPAPPTTRASPGPTARPC